jgi:hypothetical protein
MRATEFIEDTDFAPTAALAQGFNLSNPDDSTVQQPGMATAPA